MTRHAHNRVSTFYLAASSGNNGENAEAGLRAKGAMADLVDMGYTNSYDWTTNLADPVTDYPQLAVVDIGRARNASLFVLLAEPATYGGMVELGARLGGGGIAHVVGGDHFFFHHPAVCRYPTWQAFLLWARDQADRDVCTETRPCLNCRASDR